MFWIPFSLLNAIFDSFSSAFGKHAAMTIDEYSAAWASRFFSLFILVPLVLVTNSFQLPSNGFWVPLIIASVIGAVTSILFVKAIKDSPLSLTLPVVAFTPVFLLITSPLINQEFPKPLGVVGILLIVVGSYVLNLSKRIHGVFKPITSVIAEKGPRLMLAVAILWSIGANVDKIAVQNSNPFLFSLIFTFNVLVVLSILLKFKRISLVSTLKHSKTLAPIGITGGISHALQMVAITLTIVPNAIAVKRTSILFGSLWGKLFFKEEHVSERFVGAIIMVLGVVLITLT